MMIQCPSIAGMDQKQFEQQFQRALDGQLPVEVCSGRSPAPCQPACAARKSP